MARWIRPNSASLGESVQPSGDSWPPWAFETSSRCTTTAAAISYTCSTASSEIRSSDSESTRGISLEDSSSNRRGQQCRRCWPQHLAAHGSQARPTPHRDRSQRLATSQTQGLCSQRNALESSMAWSHGKDYRQKRSARQCALSRWCSACLGSGARQSSLRGAFRSGARLSWLNGCDV